MATQNIDPANSETEHKKMDSSASCSADKHSVSKRSENTYFMQKYLTAFLSIRASHKHV